MNRKNGQQQKAASIPTTTGGKVWGILYPSIFFLACQVGIGMVIGMVAAVVASLTDRWDFMSSLMQSTLGISLAAFILIAILQYFVLQSDDRRFGKVVRIWPWWKIALGAVGVAGAGIVGNLLIDASHLSEQFPLYEQIAEAAFQNQNPVLLTLTAVLIGPIAEELTFRGLTMRRACLYTKPWIGILISSFLFGLCHMNMIQFLYAFPLGILLGLLYYKSRSLWAPILAHIAANGIVFLLGM